MQLKEGMYVRTHQGIAKIVKKPNISVIVWNDRKVIYVDKNGYPVSTSFNFFVFEDEITAFSFNLIDLIEVGDYVNGTFVLDFKTLATGEKAVIVDGLINYGWGQGVIPVSDIKDIVTKEQFNSMKYVIERDK